MFEVNVGKWDRVVRAIVGLALIAGFWLWPDVTWRWAFWVGVIPLATAVAGWCPVYRLFHLNTADDRQGKARA